MFLLDAVRERPLFSLYFAIASAAVLWPLWSAPYLPLVDWPQHVAMVSFLRHYGDPQWGFHLYAVPKGIWTYITFYQLSRAFAYLLPVESACRLTLSLYMVGTPLAAAYMLRCFRLPPWGALLTFVVVYNWCFYMGFAPFLLSLPLVLVGAGLMRKNCERFRPDTAWALSVCCCLLFFSHAFAYLMLGAICVWMLLVFWPKRLRTWFFACLAWVPSMLFFGYWAYRVMTRPKQHHLMASMDAQKAGGPLAFLQANYRPWSEKVKGLYVNFNEAFHGQHDYYVAALWLACLGLLVVVGLFTSQRRKDGIRVWLLVAGAVGLYFLMPMGLLGVWAISPRFVPFAALLTILLVPPLFKRQWANAVAFLPVLALVLATATLNAKKYKAFGREAKGLQKALDAIPRGKRVYGLMYHSNSGVMSLSAYLHFPAYAMVYRGGMVGFSHFHYPDMPGRWRQVALAPYPGQSGEWYPWRWKYEIYGHFYEYILARGHSFKWAAQVPSSSGVRRLVRAGQWEVYHNPQAQKYWALYSFRENIQRAQVSQHQGRSSRPCPLQKGPRHQCPHAAWANVIPEQRNMGRVYIPCIWAHPVRGKRIRISYRQLPDQPAHRIIGLFGIADTGKGPRDYGPPVEFEVLVDGKRIYSGKTPKYRSYRHFNIPLGHTTRPRSIAFQVGASFDGARHFCFRASLFQSRKK